MTKMQIHIASGTWLCVPNPMERMPNSTEHTMKIEYKPAGNMARTDEIKTFAEAAREEWPIKDLADFGGEVLTLEKDGTGCLVNLGWETRFPVEDLIGAAIHLAIKQMGNQENGEVYIINGDTQVRSEWQLVGND